LAQRVIQRVAIIAGEASGDQIGGDLITALRDRHPGVEILGMAGPRMLAAGCHALAGMDELAVMGLVEVLKHYPRLHALRGRMTAELLAARPDVLIGIDVPDFTLEIERQARAVGIPAVHYVCPQVWAWRAGRLPKIRQSTDLILTLFPFEVPFLATHGIDAEFVGHPLADRIPLVLDRAEARRALFAGANDGPLIALMPGSRRQELVRHVGLFLRAAVELDRRRPGARYAIGAVNHASARYIRAQAAAVAPILPLEVVLGRATDLLSAADAALVASGTVTLEAALCGTPSVVAYRLAAVTYWLMRRAVKVPHVALPNLLLNERLMPEFLQNAATPTALATALGGWLEDPARVEGFRVRCSALHRSLRVGSGVAAASAVERLLERRRRSVR
jgi:lipid-A-disaccharide synthase